MTEDPPSGDPYGAPPPGQQPPYGQPPPGQQPPYGQPQYGQPQYGQQPYGWQQPYGYPQRTGTNGFAIASLVCAFFCSPLGLIFGFIARSQIKQSGQSGDGLALAGIIISALSIAAGIIILLVAAAATTPGPTY